jgi:hypothetical protein
VLSSSLGLSNVGTKHLNTPLKRIFIFGPLAAYLFYVAAIAATLNTSLFSKITGMENPEETNLTFSAAWSAIPGVIHVRDIRLSVREPTVDIDIDLRGAVVHIDLLRLFDRRVLISELKVEETRVALRMKSEPAIAESNPTDPKLEEARRLKERWKIEIAKVDLNHLSTLSFDENHLEGDMAITGAFMLQPGTQCEIFPSHFLIRNGKWNDEIHEIQLDSGVQIHHFMKADVSGSEVFRYLDAKISGSARAENLNLLKITMRTLNDYGFDKTSGKISSEITVRGGELQAGSFLHTEPTEIRLGSPRFDVVGSGEILWDVPKGTTYSLLTAKIQNAKTKIRLGQQEIAGSVATVNAEAKLYGLNLEDAFNGITARLKLMGGNIGVNTKDHGQNDEISYSLKTRIEGEISAIAGNIPKDSPPSNPSAFTVILDSISTEIPEIGLLSGKGRITLAVRPVDFRNGSVKFPKLKVQYSGKIEKKYPLVFEWNARETSHSFATAKNTKEFWRGSGILRFEKFSGILDYLSESDRISGVLRTGLSATEVQTPLEWGISKKDTWLRIEDLDSNGIWSGFGSLFSEKAAPGEDAKTRGTFKGKLLGVPIGVRLDPKGFHVKLAPSSEWYEKKLVNE